jgi:hypothetical protein
MNYERIESNQNDEEIEISALNTTDQQQPALNLNPPINRSTSVKLLPFYIVLFLMLLIGVVSYISLKHDNEVKYIQLSSELLDLKTKLFQLQVDTNNNFQSIQTDTANLKIIETNFQNSTNLNFALTSKQTNKLSNMFSDQNQTVTTHLKEITANLNVHDVLLTRLSNKTSNADVLDQLSATKKEVSNQLLTVKKNVDTSLDLVQNNITNQLTKNKEVLFKTQNSIKSQLDSNMLIIDNSVKTTKANLENVQNNVTIKIDLLENKIKKNVIELNQAVDAAQETIQSEVKVVRDNIQQYVANTNKKFDTENDFVKYQVAGFCYYFYY